MSKKRVGWKADLLASIYQQLGIDTEAKLPHPTGQTVRVIPTADEGIKRAGTLKEIL